MSVESPVLSAIRVGAVSFLNALPLTYGLDSNPEVVLTHTVPSRLPEMLKAGDLDVALVPVIDTQHSDRSWSIVGDGCIACDGATLTVRVFSRVDPADITTLHVDRDSHSSVALASILWREKHHRALQLVPFRAAGTSAEALNDCQAMMLIGDKVINPALGLDAFSTQIDLGATWKSLTGLPFVFATWAAPDPSVARRAAPILAAARDAGVARVADIAAQRAGGFGWPVDLARRYLTEHLDFTLTDRHRQGMHLFFEFAERHELPAFPREPIWA